ncbi:MAG: hypothetical protein R3D59_14290 [Paracoccaceae bacterium]
MHWARANSGAIGWGALWQDERALPESQRRIVAFQRAMNVVAGYTLSIAHNNARTFAMFSLAGAPRADQEPTSTPPGRAVQDLDDVQPHAPGRFCRCRIAVQGCDLSRRQREALEWFGDGKSCPGYRGDHGRQHGNGGKHLRLARSSGRHHGPGADEGRVQNQIYVVSRSILPAPAAAHAAHTARDRQVVPADHRTDHRNVKLSGAYRSLLKRFFQQNSNQRYGIPPCAAAMQGLALALFRGRWPPGNRR